MLIEKQASWIFSSDPAAGARNISQDGDRFSVVLNQPISIPKEAVYATLEATQATVVYVTPNVSTEIGNDKLTFDHDAVTYNFVFDKGLYAIEDINAFLGRQFTANSLPEDLFVFSGDAATQKAILTFNYAGTRIDFTVAGSINSLLGFSDLHYPLLVPSVVGEHFTGATTANINRVSTFLIHCSLARDGIPTNASGSNLITQVPLPGGSIGKTITYSPFNPIRVNVDHLIGHPVNNVDVRLSDQLDRKVDTLEEAFSVLITIRYGLQVADMHPARSYKNAKHSAAY